MFFNMKFQTSYCRKSMIIFFAQSKKPAAFANLAA